MANFLDNYQKRKHIKTKIFNTQRKVWDLEFLRENLKGEREGLRMQYDRLSEQVDAFGVRIQKLTDKTDEGLKNKTDEEIKTDIDNSNKVIEKLNLDREQLKKQMDALDSQLQGGGDQPGVNAAIDGYRSVIQLLHEFKKTI